MPEQPNLTNKIYLFIFMRNQSNVGHLVWAVGGAASGSVYYWAACPTVHS